MPLVDRAIPARFRNRREAGRQLAATLGSVPRTGDLLVLGLPRGGVPVAYEVASALAAPLDVLTVRKLGVPGHEELAMGAIATGGIQVLNQDVLDLLRIPAAMVDRVAAAEWAELARREQLYRGDAPAPPISGRAVILVDDGLATGSTMAAAVAAMRSQQPKRIVVAVPVASKDAVAMLARTADECVSTLTPDPFYGVGAWYDDFTQTTDAEVRELLNAARDRSATGTAKPEMPRETSLRLAVRGGTLAGDLAVPEGATGLVMFAHGSGSGRLSPRNRWVAAELRREHLGTLLFDLLTPAEAAEDERTGALRFDIEFLAERLIAVSDLVAAGAAGGRFRLGYFGASTGAAAALIAAVRRPAVVHAVVSRGGRPDLAGPALALVHAPTLLIVGGDDQQVIGLNRAALQQLTCVKELQVVPGATHLFPEPGALEEVARLAASWFAQHLGGQPPER